VRSRPLIVGASLLLIAGAAAVLVPRILRAGSEELAGQVEARLAAALNADCRVGGLALTSSREVELTAVACAMADGPIVGFAAALTTARFSRPPMSGQLPPIEDVHVEGLEVRLRDLPSFEAVDVEPEGDSAASERSDFSIRIEREALRFLAFSRALKDGEGGERVGGVRDRLADGGSLRIDDARFQRPGGEAVARDLHAQVERDADALALTVVAELGDGAMVGLQGTLDDAGLGGARIHFEQLPVSAPLAKLAGDSATVDGAVANGELRFADGAWALDVGLKDVLLQTDALGPEVLPMPTLALQGTLDAHDADGALMLDGGRWDVGGAGGTWTGSLTGLGSGAPDLRGDVYANRMSLGQLLGSLPDALLPSAWAEEIQGTMDFEASVAGPLHERPEWSLDWTGDFSRMVLASGELAAQVDALKRPFDHTFPPHEDGTERVRTLGEDGEHFVPLSRVSRHLVNAVVSTEDAGFFSHSGFSEHELKEAMLENLREGSGRGGSTLTQQLAKNLFLSGERTFSRKLQEAVIAWRMEQDLSKERILELYLNIAEWGPGLYGVGDAADHYFHRHPSVLKPEEAAFLASLLPSPVRYHRYYHSRRGLTRNRHDMVQGILATMHRMGRLGARDFHLARDLEIDLAACRQ